MELSQLLFIVIVGILLILVEIIFIPGTTFVGIIGTLIAAIGIFLCYKYLDSSTATWIFTGTVSISLFTIWLSFKLKLWDRFSLKKSLNEKVLTQQEQYNITVGALGRTVSALRPMGTVEINDERVEASTLGQFIDSGQQVKVIQIERNKIIVEPNQ